MHELVRLFGYRAYYGWHSYTPKQVFGIWVTNMAKDCLWIYEYERISE